MITERIPKVEGSSETAGVLHNNVEKTGCISKRID